ncbi:hypothetical protein HYALB_00009709 [Hymenoscyphus albidus]|uniref:Heterokaryon incompatibility domain-containing protein n=1 Tax=Hymenoscyphus albidus TaxID=595503 RepID=A0A9N9LGG4_9HELO|nr:hypothetical protein HYALB_00009709 [Hymenoscyphus albidus]
MACIYAGAARVLVLDSGLQHIRMRSSHIIENMSHINHCAWKRRCWTLQEGALGQCTLFLFADGITIPCENCYKNVGNMGSIGKQGLLRSWQELSYFELSLSLLYNSGPGIDPTKVHPNRWIPTVPGPNLLDDEHTMTLESGTLTISRAGDLPSKKPLQPLAPVTIPSLSELLFGTRRTKSIDQNRHSGPKTTRQLISIKPSTTSGRPLFLRVEPDLHNGNLPKFIRIDFLRQRDDEMNSLDSGETVILIEDIPEPGIMEFSSGSWAGASVHSYRAAVSCDTKVLYEVIYDCPVRVTIFTELSNLQSLYDKTQLDWDWIDTGARQSSFDFAPSPSTLQNYCGAKPTRQSSKL